MREKSARYSTADAVLVPFFVSPDCLILAMLALLSNDHEA
jgi:hypothetical protein